MKIKSEVWSEQKVGLDAFLSLTDGFWRGNKSPKEVCNVTSPPPLVWKLLQFQWLLFH